MKKLLNTLFVTSEDKYLALWNRSLTPLGVSGLKFDPLGVLFLGGLSHPPWCEWIEIAGTSPSTRAARSLTPRGVSGL